MSRYKPGAFPDCIVEWSDALLAKKADSLVRLMDGWRPKLIEQEQSVRRGQLTREWLEREQKSYAETGEAIRLMRDELARRELLRGSEFPARVAAPADAVPADPPKES